MRAVRLRVRSTLVVAAALCCVNTSIAVACEGIDAQAAPGPAAATPQVELVTGTACLIDAVRRAHGLRPLRLEAELTHAAHGHAVAMAAGGWFAHDAPDGSGLADRVADTRYTRNMRDWELGEVLGQGTGVLSTPRAIVSAWLASPGHRRELLRPAYDEIGLMIVDSPAGTLYVADLGHRRAERRKRRARAAPGTERRGTGAAAIARE